MQRTYQAILKGQLFGTVETRNMYVWSTNAQQNMDSYFCINVQSKLTAMYSAIGTWINSAFWDSYGLQVKVWDGEAWEPIYETAFSLADHTTNQGDCIGYQPSILVRMTTAAFKVAGRKFLPGFTEGATLNGVLVAQALTDLASYVLEWLTPIDMVGETAYAGVMGKGNVFHAFNGGVTGNILSSLRRRKPGYGI